MFSDIIVKFCWFLVVFLLRKLWVSKLGLLVKILLLSRVCKLLFFVWVIVGLKYMGVEVVFCVICYMVKLLEECWCVLFCVK